MILVDFNNVMMSSMHVAHRLGELDSKSSGFIIGKLRNYNVDFRNKYGELVVCADHKSWRLKYFPEYKWKRRNRVIPEDSEDEFKDFYEKMSETFDALNEFSPFRCVKTPGAEGDDVMSVLSRYPGKHVIISADKDMTSLKSSSVDIYQPIMKQFKDNGPHFLRSLVLSGDSGDGIPNILSDGDCFKNGVRQKPLTKKIKEPLMGAIDPLMEIDDLPEVNGISKDKIRENYIRNEKLIDLNKIPKVIVDTIASEFESQANKKHDIISLFTTLGVGNYISQAGDFKVVTN